MNSRFITVAGAGAVAVALVGAGLHLSSGSGSGSSAVGLSAALTSALTVNCPDVASQLGDVPAKAQAGVTAELANLDKQIANVNDRIGREPGQAANQLNDLAGKRSAVIDRIILDITRVGGTAPAGLKGLETCTLNSGAAATTAAAATTSAAAATTAAGDAAGAVAGAQTVNCPAVAGELPAIPAAAVDEVNRNLALLDTQISEANARLAKLAVHPEGGANFINNAILGPLKDKRFSTLDRIAIAIGRRADKPVGLTDLAACTLNAAGAAAPTTAAATVTAAPTTAAGNTGSAGGKAQTVNCPSVKDKLPAIPAAAADEVSRNLTLLDTQISEANARLAKLAVHPEGGANFINNAILGPLKDKRVATVNRIATAIGRVADKPAGLDSLAACTLN